MRTNRINDAHNSRGGQYLLLRTNRKRTVRGAHKTSDSCTFVLIELYDTNIALNESVNLINLKMNFDRD